MKRPKSADQGAWWQMLASLALGLLIAYFLHTLTQRRIERQVERRMNAFFADAAAMDAALRGSD